MHEGIPFAFERHWQRLKRDAERTHCPFPFEEDTVRRQLGTVLLENHVREGAARIYVIFNHIGFWRSDESFPKADLVMCTSDLPSYREPTRLGLREHARHAASPLAGVKVTSWLDNVWNYYEAQQAGFDEVVLLNERGEVCGVYRGEYFLREGWASGDAAVELWMFAGCDAECVAGDWRVGGSAGGGARAETGRSVCGG